jgi:hypothetical protein
MKPGKWEHIFVKNDIVGDVDAAFGGVKTLEPFV